MNWTPLVAFAAVIGVIFVLKRLSFISVEKARAFLQEGAVVLDVRNPAEFRSGHLPGALNIPLSDLLREVSHRFPNRNQVLFLHCLSGTRSGIARRQLMHLGYRNAFNLGSYWRAGKIMRQC